MIRILWIVGLGIVLIIFGCFTVVYGLGLIRDHPINLTPWFILAASAYIVVLTLIRLLRKVGEGRSSAADKVVE